MDIEYNPFTLFKQWFEELKKSNVMEPNAVTLSTAINNRPSSRVILVRKFNEDGFVFYTNLTSKKGKELRENPHAALNYYWMDLQKQVRIEGKVEAVPIKEADDYFAGRPRGSQIGAWASKQSSIMGYEEELLDRVKAITEKFAGGPIDRPPFWSGYRLIPDYFEFWQEGEYRLHKRIIYEKKENSWECHRLFP